MNLPFKTFLACGIFAAALSCCKPDDNDPPCTDPANPECENYDPCFGKLETTAFFTIAQQYFPIGENAEVFIEDDVVTGGLLKFKAIFQEGATYTWILGVDTIVGGHEVIRALGDLPEGTYGNSLIVSKQPDTLCFPTDDGVATFSKPFIRIDGCERAILGKFRCKFEGLQHDSINIEIASSSSLNEIAPCSIASNTGALFSVNFNLENDTIILNRNGYVNSRISFESLGEQGVPEGELTYDANMNVLNGNYHINGTQYLVKGRKLN